MLQIQKNSTAYTDAAYSLIEEVYKEENYMIQKNDFVKYHNQRTFFTLHKYDELIGTISLIECKGKETLPLSSLYASELEGLLKTYSRVYEVGSFAINKKKFGDRVGSESLKGTQLLFRAVYEEAKRFGADLLVVAINPKHLSFYTLIGFQTFGEQKFYPFVEAAAVPLYLNLKSGAVAESFLSRV